jgi:hypothetical protein
MPCFVRRSAARQLYAVMSFPRSVRAENAAGMPAARERSAPACADALQAGIQKCPQFVPGIVKERHLWIPACAGMTGGEAGMTGDAGMTDETE